MEKLQGLCKVVGLEITDALADWNDANDTERARLIYEHETSAADETPVEGVDSDAMELLGTIVGGNRFSVIVDISTFAGKTTDDKLTAATDKLKGKEVVFTTYRFKCSEVSDFDVLHTEDRNRRIFTRGYLGRMNDEARAHDEVADEISRELADGSLLEGSLEDEKSDKKRHH